MNDTNNTQPLHTFRVERCSPTHEMEYILAVDFEVGNDGSLTLMVPHRDPKDPNVSGMITTYYKPDTWISVIREDVISEGGSDAQRLADNERWLPILEKECREFFKETQDRTLMDFMAAEKERSDFNARKVLDALRFIKLHKYVQSKS